MNRYRFSNVVILALCVAALVAAPAAGQNQSSTGPAIAPDNRNFELTPVGPPVPALKYRLHFTMAERIPGNAAPLILDAVLLMGPTAAQTVSKANDAYEAGDFKTFDSLADSLDLAPVWDELDPAMRRLHSDFDPPLREKHELTLLPHLVSIRTLAWLIRVRAVRQLEQGKVNDAISTIRLGYELTDKMTDPVIIAALVSAGCTRIVNDTTARLMNNPGSPNLYWALVNEPLRYPILRRAWDAEHEWAYVVRPRLAGLRDGDEPTPQQWRTILDDDLAIVYADRESNPGAGARHLDPINDATPKLLARARQDYAESHHVSPEQAAKVDPAIALGHFYYRQWQVAQDDLSELRGLPYPILLPKTAESWDNLQRLKADQPTNPFLEHIAHMHRAIYSFARADRELAALTTVEALRSYAAAHEGHLPARLEDLTQTPAPMNPVTGKPFEYHVADNVATLADTRSESTLTYTIRIRPR